MGAGQAASQAADFSKLAAECGFGDLAQDLLLNCSGDVAAATAALQQLAFGSSSSEAPPSGQPGHDAPAAAQEAQSAVVAVSTQQQPPRLWDALPPDCRRVNRTARAQPRCHWRVLQWTRDMIVSK